MYLSGYADPTVKYHSLKIYILTATAKTSRDSIWWVVLVGRYPPLSQFAWANWLGEAMAPPEVLSTSKQTNLEGPPLSRIQLLGATIAKCCSTQFEFLESKWKVGEESAIMLENP